MAGRLLNRRALREQADHVEQREAIVPDTPPVAAPASKSRKAKVPAAPKAKKANVKKASPRMRARWGVFDGGMKQLAIFDYNQRATAEEKVADLLAKKKGPYFLQMVKEPMPDPAPADAPAPE